MRTAPPALPVTSLINCEPTHVQDRPSGDGRCSLAAIAHTQPENRCNPFLQQPDAVYLALLGLLNLILAPVVPLYYRGARQQLQHLACALLVVAVVLQTLTLLARPEMGNLAALVCAGLAVAAHLAAGLARSARKARTSQPATQDSGNRDTGTVKWFNTSKVSASSPGIRAMISSCTFAPFAAKATASWSRASAWSSR